MKRIELMVIGAELVVIIGILVFFLALGQSSASVAKSMGQGDQVISITVKKFSYTPPQVVLKKGQAVVLELTSLDRQHGFRLEELGIRADVKPGETTRVRLVPQQAGQFSFACDVFCGSGHEDMAGEIIVVD